MEGPDICIILWRWRKGAGGCGRCRVNGRMRQVMSIEFAGNVNITIGIETACELTVSWIQLIREDQLTLSP